LALSAALLFSGQLGVLSPRYTVALCRRALGFLDFQAYKPEVIGPPLSSARIELVQTGQSIVATFYPDVATKGTMELEESVCRLLNSYLYYIEKAVIPELVGYLRSIILMAVIYYLSVALKSELESASFNPNQVSSKLNLSMVEFTSSIYAQWRGGPTLPTDRYKSKLTEAKKHVESVAGKLK
jgi:hypothetical protein